MDKDTIVQSSRTYLIGGVGDQSGRVMGTDLPERIVVADGLDDLTEEPVLAG